MTRPPMIQHWLIATTVRAAFLPLIHALEAQAVYWDTWHSVWRAR